jgi:hypothetical protein
MISTAALVECRLANGLVKKVGMKYLRDGMLGRACRDLPQNTTPGSQYRAISPAWATMLANIFAE